MKVGKKVISFYLIEKLFNNNSLKNMKAKIVFFVSLFFILNLSFAIEHCEAQWQQCEGIYGGTVFSLAASENKIFAGTINGVYVSTNNGTSWMQTALNNTTVNSLAISGNNVFAATGYYGVFLSTNSGSSWVQTALNNVNISSLVSNENTILAGTNYLGVYLSTNNGVNWTQTGLYDQDVSCLAFGENTFYAGTNNGLYLSTNNGQRWTQTALNNKHVTSILLISGNNSEGSSQDIFAGTFSNEIFFSTNNGLNWTQTNFNYSVVSELAAIGNTVFAGTPVGIFISENNGLNWVKAPLNKSNISSFAANGNKIFAGSGNSGVYFSTNNGQNWTQSNLNNKIILSLASYGNNIYAGTRIDGVYRTTNNGQNWIQTSLINHEILSLAIISNNPENSEIVVFAGSNDSGIFISTNSGQNWTRSTLNIRRILSIAVRGNTPESSEEVIFAGTGDYGVYISTNNGQSWNQTSLNNKTVSSLIISGNNIFAAAWDYTNQSGVYLSTNNGSSWTQTALNNKYVNSLAISGNNIFAGTSDSGVYISTNNGTTWFKKNHGWSLVPSVSALLIANNYIFAGTYNYSVWRRSLSEITGDSIHTVSGTVKYSDNNQPVSGGYVKALKLNYSTMQMETIDSTGIQSNGTYTLPNVRTDSVYIRPYPNSTTTVDFIPTYYPSSITWENATVLYVTSNLNNIDVGVVRVNISSTSSTISGNVFKTTYNQLPGLKDALLYVKFNNEIKGFAFSNNEGYYLLNNMPTGSYKVYANRPGYKSDSVTVLMPPGGILSNINYTLYPVWTSIKKIESGIVTEYRLEQNYPNPFNSKTKIKFDVKKPGNVKLKVFDITGKLVADIINNELETGRYEVLFDAKNLSSSIYFYRMETGEFVETKRMVHIK